MERRKTLTMNWAALGDVDDDDDCFFETCERISSAVPQDLAYSSDEEDNFQDTRISFSCRSSVHSFRAISVSRTGAAAIATAVVSPDYDVWMAAPGSIRERRKRLLLGMGLDENKDSLKVTSLELERAITRKFENANANANANANTPAAAAANANANSSSSSSPSPSLVPAKTMTRSFSAITEEPKSDSSHSPVAFVMGRSRSDGDIDSISTIARKEEFIGKISKQRLTRTSTEIVASRAKICTPYHDGSRVTGKDSGVADQSQRRRGKFASANSISRVGAFFLIKNLDTGKEFIVNEYRHDGMWNKVSDLQTGKQLTIEEFEQTVGHSPVVKELMRRENAGGNHGNDRKLAGNNCISKSLRMSKKRGAAVLKSIKGVASGYFGEREREATEVPPPALPSPEQKQAQNDWVRVRQTGKSTKDLSALHLSQEIQAHEGCIWTIKFSSDGHYLASAGEDKMIHVWEVQECEVMSLRPEDGSLTPIHPSLLASPDRNGQAEPPSLAADKKKKKGKSASKRGNPIPDYVHVPETVFSLSEKPFCSFQGHQDDVLDLSWSSSQQLLSSSMDKTVRLWDLESKTCLKLFAHNDYVTCIQFNPVDDDYFISGSLDAKVRIWNVPDRQVVDWIDAREMVTAISYTPDAQAALLGTHKGTCRTYSTEDCKLSQTNAIELRHKKKANLRKVTGFQFVPGNPSQALVTSADSRIRIVEGTEVVQKFTGFRNANSQIAASFSSDGRYVICASEDSQVYVWKHEKLSNGKGKGIVVIQSHEHFPCKDVSVAIIWPCTIKGEPPAMPSPAKKQAKRPPAASQATPTGGSSSIDDNSKKSMLPPLPKKNPSPSPEIASTSPQEDPAAISRTDSGVGDSFASGSASIKDGDSSSSFSASTRYGGDSPSISSAANPSSASMSSNWSSAENGQGGATATNSTAWGLVIVTAGFGGEIRCYQNFGLPRKVSR